MITDKGKEFWENLLAGLGFKARHVRSISGASGINHPVLALGVDEPHERLVIVSGDGDARTAAMMQIDVQNEISDARVLVIRPVVFGLATLAHRAIEETGASAVDLVGLIEKFKERPESEQKLGIESVAKRLVTISPRATEVGTFNVLGDALAALTILSSVNLEKAGVTDGKRTWNFERLEELAQMDRLLGTCEIPLYKFTDADWDAIWAGRLDEFQPRLLDLGISQYFYPPTDVAAISIIERSKLPLKDVSKAVEHFPRLGHPLTTPEILEKTTATVDLVDALRDRGLIVDGELSVTGNEIRAAVRFKPREGAVSRLISALKLNFTTNITFK